MSYKCPPEVLEKIRHFAKFPQTPVSLKQMVNFGSKPTQSTLARGTQFIHAELPVRLAHRVVELESLPHNLSEMQSVIKVKNMYTQSFQDLIEFPSPSEFGLETSSWFDRGTLVPPADSALKAAHTSIRYFKAVEDVAHTEKLAKYNQMFVKCIEKVKRRHDPVVSTIAQGIVELKEHWRKTNAPYLRDPRDGHSLPLPPPVQSFLDRFYLSRIGIRMLIGQHVAISKPEAQQPGFVGIICPKTSLRNVALDAIDDARFICQDYYGLWKAPDIKLYGKQEIEFMYVPSHLHHMLFELLKNSLRAVVERYGADCEAYPEIRVVVAEGKEDITIKISDEGGGIPRSGMPLIWSYMYTTAESPMLQENYDKSDFKAPMAGFGYGLPLSRLYARYFGGDLKLISMEGYGTDAYLHLSRLSDSEEPLP
ncbi:mitochondrial branched-chain alpha-ketoacid dehydrogenase kinase-domain-containing protein [Polychytrium aggregatum]|uniref:mitochondrial branched-chain alpha-ketoacid dehydrogenase kinase-domain-containing protein n=1 Tax=Polychytrium aggregatum TaxID=110093 RepID=UPI0022FE1237|nr:mitochondrial branched-chain alpha-ketoacid dehydrogenase kinase-domain-containing protein [Polychytrium aggregatum]KAI9193115.1 mitochondrial branched-chain alpha-ketoacid dehydrogenase kinase-domain-containing protein [Polychytrium aggregatum]